jgi:ABC-2 type transport system permease protein
MSYLRLFFIFFKIGLLNELEYRVNFFVQLFQSLLSLGAALAGLSIIFAHTKHLGDWTAPQIGALLGVFIFVGGAINLVLRPSMQKLMEDVRRGTLDLSLTKPEDAQVLASVKGIEVWKLVDMVLGVVVLSVALGRMGTTPSAWQVFSFVIAISAGGAIIYSFWLMLATLTFWFVRMENILVIFESMYEAGRWPMGLYPSGLKAVLYFVVPVAFAVTVPVEALLDKPQRMALLGVVGVALLALGLSRWFWRLGIRHYSGASA